MGAILSTTVNALPPLHDILLPTPEVYQTLLNIFQYFPLVTVAQWLTSWHPAGKTSTTSYLNLPGRLAWFTMEIIGPINLLYILTNLPPELNMQTLPLPNKLVASLYVIHYINRAIISPFFAAPSMSPIHAFVMASAMLFNWFNSSCLACWLVGYNVATIPGYYYPPPLSTETILSETLTSKTTTATSLFLPSLGLALFTLGMAGNILAERTLFSLRRKEADKQARKDEPQAAASHSSPSPSEKPQPRPNKYHKVYVIPPPQGLFASILYPHYLCEWLEWTGFALLGTAVFPTLSAPGMGMLGLSSGTGANMPQGFSAGSAMAPGASPSTPTLRLAPWLVPAVYLAERLRVPFLPLPAMVFVVNAVANMLPHARWGRKWYVERFGEGKVAGRGAVVPFVSWL
ncbi:hypothetical protein BJX61DRAFT_251658 [Aspergillus egyptiacus]|nr:hypothetical protein BJX61DRAFT_251658 [Aspergillus egyptiacus]